MDLIKLYRRTILFKARGEDYFVCLFFEKEAPENDILEAIICTEFAGITETYSAPSNSIFCCYEGKELPVLEFQEIQEDLDPFYAVKVDRNNYLFLNGNRDALEGIRIHHGNITSIAEYQLSYKRNIVSDVYIFRFEYTFDDIRERFNSSFIPCLKRSLCII